MAHEHHKAMILLIAHQLNGSALSIIRLQFEAYIRGVWLHHCATEAELTAFKQGQEFKFYKLIEHVNKLEAFSEGVLSTAHKRSWKAMCSYTHTGFLQVVRRNKEATIEPDYEDDELIEVLGFANAIALLSALEIANMAGRDDVSRNLLELTKTIATPGPAR